MYIHRRGQDLLQVAASEFNKLIGKKVKLILGRKGRSEEVTIVFDSSDFHQVFSCTIFCNCLLNSVMPIKANSSICLAQLSR